MLDQSRTPYFDALLDYVEKGTISFHCPGHKHGKGIHKKLRDKVGLQGLAFDLTEVLGLDDLHQPQGVIKEAQQLASEAYGADRSYFLINGSTSGVQSAMLGVLNHGDKIIMPRNAHRSAVSALIITGAIPAYMIPEYDYELFIDHNVTVDTVREALDKHPDAKALFLVSPTYYGVAADLKSIVDLVHSKGKIIIVDEAWGPHLHFHPHLPISAVDAGADIIINSTHKLIGGLSQGAMLHLKGDRVNVARLESSLRFFMSTSPSCLILASLDVARMQMATEGTELLTQTIEIAEYGREEINNIENVSCFGREIIGRPGVFDLDPTKLTINFGYTGYSGHEINQILRYKYGIQVELTDVFNILALVTIGNTFEEVKKLVDAIRDIVKNNKRNICNKSLLEQLEERIGKKFELPDWPEQKLTPREAFIASSEEIPVEKAAGRICAELITPYPPGIPIICPGEVITKEIIDYIRLEIQTGGHIQGLADSLFSTVRVVK